MHQRLKEELKNNSRITPPTSFITDTTIHVRKPSMLKKWAVPHLSLIIEEVPWAELLS